MIGEEEDDIACYGCGHLSSYHDGDYCNGCDTCEETHEDTLSGDKIYFCPKCKLEMEEYHIENQIGKNVKLFYDNDNNNDRTKRVLLCLTDNIPLQLHEKCSCDGWEMETGHHDSEFD